MMNDEINDEINDDIIIDFFFKNDKLNSNKTKLFNLNQIDISTINYLNNRFKDKSDSYIEILNRIKFNIKVRPVCKCCGGPVKWISKNNYREYCSCSCRNKDQYEIIKNKSIEKYGSPFNRDKFKQTIINKFGEDNWCNRNKQKETVLKFSEEKKEEIKNKKFNTNLKLYNDKNYNNREQSKLTTFLHYGVNCWYKTDECKERSKLITNKKEILKKIQQTCLLKYGYKAFNNKKSKQTKLEKYGNKNYNNREKAKQTMINLYGVENIYNLEYYKKLAHNKNSLEKINNTKKKNYTFNTSIPENKSYDLLKEKYKDIEYQYKNDLYPFNCDFYIPSLDLYIECNYHWTHGGKPYEGTEEDNIKLNKWKEKNTKFYNNAINIWTIRDVNKRNIAKQNKLNYIEFWDLNELKNWLNT